MEARSNHYCGRPEPNLGFVNHVDFQFYHACVCLSVHQLFITFMTLYMTVMYIYIFITACMYFFFVLRV